MTALMDRMYIVMPCYDGSGMLVCGYASDDDANGRTIGKVAMYVGQSAWKTFVGATASVDGVATDMINDTWVTDSVNAGS